MRFCCKPENFAKSAQIWSQRVPLVLTKKTSTYTLFLTINNEVIWGLKSPNHDVLSAIAVERLLT